MRSDRPADSDEATSGDSRPVSVLAVLFCIVGATLFTHLALSPIDRGYSGRGLFLIVLAIPLALAVLFCIGASVLLDLPAWLRWALAVAGLAGAAALAVPWMPG